MALLAVWREGDNRMSTLLVIGLCYLFWRWLDYAERPKRK